MKYSDIMGGYGYFQSCFIPRTFTEEMAKEIIQQVSQLKFEIIPYGISGRDKDPVWDDYKASLIHSVEVFFQNINQIAGKYDCKLAPHYGAWEPFYAKSNSDRALIGDKSAILANKLDGSGNYYHIHIVTMYEQNLVAAMKKMSHWYDNYNKIKDEEKPYIKKLFADFDDNGPLTVQSIVKQIEELFRIFFANPERRTEGRDNYARFMSNLGKN